MRAEKIAQNRLFSNPKIRVIWDSAVEEILGTEDTATGAKSVTGVRIKNLKNQMIQDVPVHGVFVAIGHDPATKIFAGQVAMDEDGYIITAADSTATNVPGVFAAGDVKDKVYRQAVTAAGMGCMAALEAERFIAENLESATEKDNFAAAAS